MKIKEITPDTPKVRQKITKGTVMTLVDASTKTYEAISVNGPLTNAEIEYIKIAINLKKVTAAHIRRWQTIKREVCSGLTQKQIADKYKSEKGYCIAHIKHVRAALSAFNGWDLR